MLVSNSYQIDQIESFSIIIVVLDHLERTLEWKILKKEVGVGAAVGVFRLLANCLVCVIECLSTRRWKRDVWVVSRGRVRGHLVLEPVLLVVDDFCSVVVRLWEKRRGVCPCVSINIFNDDA